MPVGLANRRTLIAALGGAAAWPLVARAQQPVERIRRVGVMMAPAENDPEGQARKAALQKGFGELGWIEGRTIQIDYRWNGGDPARAKSYAAELVQLRPDVIVANGTLSLKTIRQETSTTPIVFVVVGDPLGQGFIGSVAHPGGNMTGIASTDASFAIGGKWLELAKEIAPSTRRFAILFNPAAGAGGEKVFASIAPPFEAQLVLTPTRDPAELERAITGMADDPERALIVVPDAFIQANRGLIISLAARYRLPAIYPFRRYALDGGLMSYGADINNDFQRVAAYVDKILKGANAGDLPVELPTKFELVINLKTAKALGLTVPPSLLIRADEVIE